VGYGYGNKKAARGRAASWDAAISLGTI